MLKRLKIQKKFLKFQMLFLQNYLARGFLHPTLYKFVVAVAVNLPLCSYQTRE